MAHGKSLSCLNQNVAHCHLLGCRGSRTWVIVVWEERPGQLLKFEYCVLVFPGDRREEGHAARDCQSEGCVLSCTRVEGPSLCSAATTAGRCMGLGASCNMGETWGCVRQEDVLTNSVHWDILKELVCSAQREWDMLSPFSGMWHKWLGNLECWFWSRHKSWCILYRWSKLATPSCWCTGLKKRLFGMVRLIWGGSTDPHSWMLLFQVGGEVGALHFSTKLPKTSAFLE